MNGYSMTNYEAMLKIAKDKPLAIGECARLPSPSVLAAQPRWAWFLAWAELVKQHNTIEEINAFYNHPRVVNRGDINLGFTKVYLPSIHNPSAGHLAE
jgi:mannan endo-1,4-beta-mannosidase